MTIQGSRAKGQSVMEKSSKVKTPSLLETRASRVTFEKPPEKMTKHLRPLYIRAHIDRKPVSRVLVDNVSTVNILPLRMVRRLSKSEQDLIPSEVSVTSFDGGVSQTKGLISVDLTMGKTTKVSAFLVLLAYKCRAKEVAIRSGVGLKYLASKMAAAEKLIYLKKKDSAKYKANKNAQGKGGREKEK
ncbi:hypothetical protein ES288_D06G067800v1 [Gossypium darwinii]|uniref:Uncharacterized protein n=1 Tax=Gossypium darwinii TaxID=34276 RepID=A0A5D2C2S8_GOSDA|nr:hypothetical protein ES288_D06G067800v1 [Gossypium darwinii]